MLIHTRGVEKYRYTDISQHFISRYCIYIPQCCFDFLLLLLTIQIFMVFYFALISWWGFLGVYFADSSPTIHEKPQKPQYIVTPKVSQCITISLPLYCDTRCIGRFLPIHVHRDSTGSGLVCE